MSPAIFFDKDSMLVQDGPHNVDLAQLRFRDDTGPALRALQQAGYKLLLVRSPPGIAGALLDETPLGKLWESVKAELGLDGVTLTNIYQSLHDSETNDRSCRPKPDMLQQAAEEHDIDLEASWMVGDILDDIEAGCRAGCRTILLDVGSEVEWRSDEWRRPGFIADTLADVAAHILATDGKPAPENAAQGASSMSAAE